MHSLYKGHLSFLVVGAGPAGLGVATALKQAGVRDTLIIDAREIGASFMKWPRQMSLLTPSFHSNSFGLTDLNSIEPETSPADFLRTQHPTGPQYAKYLQAVAEYHELPVQTGIQLTKLEKQGDQFFADWRQLEGDEFTVIGGYESGVDAALNLVDLGKSVYLHSRGEPWSSDHPDPSRSLSPRTFDRLREVLKSEEKMKRLELFKNSDIRRIEENRGWWALIDQDEIPSVSPTQPILANGFHSGLRVIESLFDYDENNLPVFTEEADESTIPPGLFYSGPALVHRNSLFCFIYKFRSRFGVIAREIANRLGKSEVEEKLSLYLKTGFMNTDLDCCTECKCAIKPAEVGPEPAAFA